MTALFAICDDQWALVKTASSPMGLKASTFKTYSNAALDSVEDLRANYVLVIDQGTKPDQEWETVIGNPTVVIDGDPEQPETMTATLQYSTQPISLDAAKAKLKEKVKQCKFTRMDAGVEFDLDGEIMIAQTDSESRSLLMGVYFKAVSGGLPNGRNWRFLDNSYPLLTTAQVIALGDTVDTMVSACYDQQDAHDAAIEALPDIEACITYDCTAGFPAAPAAN
ncbi:DUF4376 domain-containing protein [Thalassospira xiamenensis]|uniref:DUF4376 domain-containing protein n=1 Tax=Thalassospira xiamenensis TaxID=220697 RepID=A0A285TZA7_9PROT|nr:DUF4376 domain-containing protein [Thalassospira xiamenensis]SOC28228.1 protein of unknown function [Thalassospira xiamenensis]